MDDRIFKFLKDMKRDTNGEFPELPDDKAQELGDDLIEEYIESLFEKYTYHDEDGNKQVMNATCKDESQTFCNTQNLKSVNAYHHAIANRWAALLQLPHFSFFTVCDSKIVPFFSDFLKEEISL